MDATSPSAACDTMDSDSLNRPLRVADFIATRSGDEDRGPMVVMNPDDARTRLLTEGELATVRVDPGMRLGDVGVRDISGVAPSEIVRVVKPDLDSRGRRPPTAYA